MYEIHFYQNDILVDTDLRRKERILWVDYQVNELITIELDTDKFNLLFHPIAMIEEKVISKTITIEHTNANDRLISLEDLTPIQIEQMEKNYEMIMSIASITNEPMCFDKDKRGKMIKAATEQFNVSKKCIYKQLRRYWQSGKRKSSLAPHYASCGNKGKDKKLGAKKTGRPSNYACFSGIETGSNVDEETKEIFKSSINKYYLNTNKLSLAQTYDLVVEDWCRAKGYANMYKDISWRNKVPTLRQFRYWYHKQRNYENELRFRHGTKKYEKDLRNLVGDSMIEVSGPGYRYQIDATVADIFLVSRRNRTSVIGRPTVYIAVDVFSRLITAVYVGLDGAGWNGASTLIKNMCEDKVEMCHKYGIEIKEEDWPSVGLPSIILGDRGEMIGPIAENICAELGIMIENTPSYRGDAKGIVEQKFRTIQSEFKKWSPGIVRRAYRERGEKDYRLDATLDIDEFTKIILEIVLHHNKKFLRDYKPIDEMERSGVKHIPTEIWKWGIENLTGALRRLPDTKLNRSLLRKGMASMTEKGLLFKGNYYICQIDKFKEWEVLARNKGRTSVQVRYDNRNLSTIYIDYNDDIVEATLNCNFTGAELYLNLSEEEIAMIMYDQNIRHHEVKQDQLLKNKELNDSIREVVKEAKKQSPTGNADIKEIRNNRKEENTTHRATQAIIQAESKDVEKEAAATVEIGVKEEKKGLYKLLEELEEEYL